MKQLKKIKLGLSFIEKRIAELRQEKSETEEYLTDEDTGLKIQPRNYNLSEYWAAENLKEIKAGLESLEEIQKIIKDEK